MQIQVAVRARGDAIPVLHRSSAAAATSRYDASVRADWLMGVGCCWFMEVRADISHPTDKATHGMYRTRTGMQSGAWHAQPYLANHPEQRKNIMDIGGSIDYQALTVPVGSGLSNNASIMMLLFVMCVERGFFLGLLTNSLLYPAKYFG